MSQSAVEAPAETGMWQCIFLYRNLTLWIKKKNILMFKFAKFKVQQNTLECSYLETLTKIYNSCKNVCLLWNFFFTYFSITTTSHKPYMTVSPVDGRLYLSDLINHRVIRVATMGPVRNLSANFELVAGNRKKEQCTPGSLDQCGDGGPATNARLVHPKGKAVKHENRATATQLWLIAIREKPCYIDKFSKE